MQKDLFGNMPGLSNTCIHFAFPESFRNTFERVDCGNELWKAVKRKDTNVSKHHVGTEKHENNNKKERKNIIPFMAIEPTDQNAYDCESSVLTTMLERMLLFTASYDKYILSRSITQKVQHSVQ